MNNIVNIINDWDSHKDEHIYNLCRIIINNASVETLLKDDVDKLLTDNIISENKEIISWDIVLCYILKIYEHNGQFSFSSEPETWQAVDIRLREIKSFNWHLHKQLHNVALIFINKFHPNNFNDFILSETLNVWMIISALQRTIDYLDISAENFFDLTKKLTEKHYNDMAISQLYNTVKTYCQNNTHKGYEFLNICIDCTSFPLNNILIGCMFGLLSVDYLTAKAKLITMLDKDNLRESIIYAFANYIETNPDKSQELLTEIKSHKDYNGNAELQFYWKLYRLNNDLRLTAESNILEIIENPSEEIINTAIQQLIYFDSISDFIRVYINKITDNAQFSIEHFKLLDNTIAYKICDTNTLIDIIKSAYRFKFQFNVNAIEGCINSVKEKDSNGFALAVVDLLTDNDGIIRHFGRSVWDFSNLVNSDFDPLTLSIELQFSFMISMLQDGINPQNRLKKVLPLFDSPHQPVRQLLLIQLYPYIDNYLGTVIQELDTLDLSNSEEIPLLRDYFKNRCAFIDARVACKELNPLYTQCKVQEEFNRAESLYMKSVMKEAEKNSKSAFLDLFTPVILAKGGGFREEDGTVRELAHISHSVPFPAMYASFTELEEIKMNSKTFANWNNITDIWEIL